METGKNKAGDKSCFGNTELKKNNLLVISSSASNFLYSFIDLKSYQCVGLCSIIKKETSFSNPNDVLDLVKEQPDLLKGFVRTKIVFTNRECTLIPEEIFKEEDTEKYIDLLFPDTYSGNVHIMHLPSLENYLVYKIPVAIDEFYKESFPGVVFEHSTGNLLSTLSRISFLKKNTLIHVNFSQKSFEVVMCKKGKLLFYNSFEYQTSEEIAYYILFALKQWEIEPEEVMVSGELNPDSDELYWLKKYIPKVISFPVDELLPYPASIENPSNYIGLLNPEVCE